MMLVVERTLFLYTRRIIEFNSIHCNTQFRFQLDTRFYLKTFRRAQLRNMIRAPTSFETLRIKRSGFQLLLNHVVFDKF